LRLLILLLAMLACDPVDEPIAVLDAPVVAVPTAKPDRRALEAAVVGRDAGALDVDRWVQGSATLDDADATVLVFMEPWCPHCRNEAPELQALYERWGDRGVNVVALTRMSRGTTDQQLDAFIGKAGATYPVAVVDQEMADRFGVRGVPAAAVVSGGRVVWRGHPGRLHESVLEDAVGS
jgi:thiol-disulfide isomerase/thioredoxin